LLDNKNLVKTFNEGRGEEKKKEYITVNILGIPFHVTDNVQPLQKHPKKTEMLTYNVQSNAFPQ
jgi:hypothetical protein